MRAKKVILYLCLLCLLTSCFDSGFTKVAKSFGQHSEEVLIAPAYRSYNAIYKKLYHKKKNAIMMEAKIQNLSQVKLTLIKNMFTQ